MIRKKESPKPFTTLTVYVNGEHIPFSVSLGTNGMKHVFLAHWKNPDLSGTDIHSESSDIERLKQQMQKKLEGEMKYEWRRMLRVEVDSSLPDGSVDFVAEAHQPQKLTRTEAKISLTICQYEIAKSKTGREVHRCNDGSGTVMEGLPDTGPRQSQDWNERDMTSMVPDTVENRRALQAVLEGFAQLRDKLAEVLSPENIDDSLQKIREKGALALEDSLPR